MNKRVVFAVLVVLLGSACGDNTAGSPMSPASKVTTESPTTTTQPPDEPFTASVNDVIAQINLQLPLLIEDETPTILPGTISGSTAVCVGEFGVSPLRIVRVVVGRGRFG